MKILNTQSAFMRAGLAAAIILAGVAHAEVIRGTVTKVDKAAKTVAVRTAEGAEHTLHVTEKVTVKGGEEAGKESWTGLKEGSEVVARYSAKGGEKTAVEFGRVGKDGLKVMDGTLVGAGKGAKTIVVKSADGTEHTFVAADHAAEAAGKATAHGAERTGKVTVYYTEKAGKKIAHFFWN